MNRRSRFIFGLFVPALLLTLVTGLQTLAVESVITPVAISGQPAPGLTNKVKFSNFEYVSLADNGQIAFTARADGPGVTTTNSLGLWAGLPSNLGLIARTGVPVSNGTNNGKFKYFASPNIDNQEAVGFLGFGGPFPSSLPPGGDPPPPPDDGKSSPAYVAPLRTRHFIPSVNDGPSLNDLTDALVRLGEALKNATARFLGSLLGHVVGVVAGQVKLSGPDIDPGTEMAIVVGPHTNAVILARQGFPAPGMSGNFTSLADESRRLALAPDGNVAFIATASDPPATRMGVWFGKAGTLQMVAGKGAAPDSLLGPGYTTDRPSSENVEVNAQGELAFAVYLNGPNLNGTNSEFVVAGKPGNFRVVAQSGKPAPGIAGAFFRPYFGGSAAFSHVLLGADGTVAFVGCYSGTGTDFGLWLAPTNGATPILLMRSGQQAPGAPAGAMFTNSFAYLPPFESIHMNARNQIVFLAKFDGPGIAPNYYGIWQAEPDGTLNLIARAGDTLDIGGGVIRELANVSFGVDPEFIAGPEDGRRSPFNDRGEILFRASWQNPPGAPSFGSYGEGLFLAQAGLVLRGVKVGSDIQISFPTLAGKHYRVEYATSQPAVSWSALGAAVAGTGAAVTVTDSDAATLAKLFYRVVRLD